MKEYKFEHKYCGMLCTVEAYSEAEAWRGLDRSVWTLIGKED